jgi:hypothetical protein
MKIQALARANLTRRYLNKVKAVRPQLTAAVESRNLAQLDKALLLVSEVSVESLFEKKDCVLCLSEERLFIIIRKYLTSHRFIFELMKTHAHTNTNNHLCIHSKINNNIKIIIITTTHNHKTLGVFASFSVALPIKEWDAAREMRGVLFSAESYTARLSQDAYADLADDANFERLVSTMSEEFCFKCYKLK